MIYIIAILHAMSNATYDPTIELWGKIDAQFQVAGYI
jgi:hypothetical protein